MPSFVDHMHACPWLHLRDDVEECEAHVERGGWIVVAPDYHHRATEAVRVDLDEEAVAVPYEIR